MVTKAQQIGRTIRRVLKAYADAAPQECAVALSGGVDSCSVLAALYDAGRRPVVVSYTPSTHDSTDFVMAQRTARNLELEFVPVRVPMTPEELEKMARYVIEAGYVTKLEVECISPMVYVIAACPTEIIYTGDQSDGYFINNNWMSRNFDRARGLNGPQRTHVKADTDAWRIDELRRLYYEQDRSCSGALEYFGREEGVNVVVPYRSAAIREAFTGSLWSDVNVPRLKEPIHWAYRDYFRDGLILVRPTPVNLHRGDSLFAVTMGETLMARFPGSWRTPTGLYAAMSRGEV